MLINLLRGDLKVVGVRPLSQHYFNLYSRELQEKRIKYKPGLVPPFYADLPKTLQEIMDSEMKYLEQYEQHPIITDIKYFFKAFYNIIFKRARSN
jgi:lipopolysaccharide/colanic/teichoic acid biosynthesis glycosyltransferase